MDFVNFHAQLDINHMKMMVNLNMKQLSEHENLEYGDSHSFECIQRFPVHVQISFRRDRTCIALAGHFEKMVIHDQRASTDRARRS